VRYYDYIGALVHQPFRGRGEAYDARVVAYFATIGWDVQIRAHDYALAHYFGDIG
jgi:hypothetical protein